MEESGRQEHLAGTVLCSLLITENGHGELHLHDQIVMNGDQQPQQLEDDHPDSDEVDGDADATYDALFTITISIEYIQTV